MRARERRLLIFCAAAFTLLLFLELPGSSLLEPDEARYAEIPREMLATGDFVTHEFGSNNSRNGCAKTLAMMLGF